MQKRLMMIGLLGISLVAMLAAEANAQFDGWGWFGFSDIVGVIDTIHTPPPQSKPSQIQVTVDTTVQIACLNPANNGISNGKAFRTTVTGSTQLGEGDITDRKSGKARTEVKVSLDQFEVPANCTNPRWTPIDDSAIALDFKGTVMWCLLDETGALDCSRKGFLDSSPVTCTLDTTDPLNQRNPNGTAPHTAVFSCEDPQ